MVWIVGSASYCNMRSFPSIAGGALRLLTLPCPLLYLIFLLGKHKRVDRPIQVPRQSAAHPI